MNKKQLQNILTALPEDFVQNAVRDITLPTAAIFVDAHCTGIPKKFGPKFRALITYDYGDQTGFMRSPYDYEVFSQKMAHIFRHSPTRTKKIIEDLEKFSKWFYNFVKKYKTLEAFIKMEPSFFQNYYEFFILHQVVGFGTDYLAKISFNKKNKKVTRTIEALGKAYKYNELVVPVVEKYFKKLKVTNLLPEEINSNIEKNKAVAAKHRSIIGLKGKRFALSSKDASWLKKEIDKKQLLTLKGSGSVNGIIACRGVVTGKVRVITSLSRLDTIKAGEILVTTMTRPQYNNILQKAKAFVTDEGGMICHAALLAREYKIPCIVGTKTATKIFKSGDVVKVDANKGIVTKL